MLKTVEIASYPKSGNTWFRHVIAEFLATVSKCQLVPSDIHRDKNSVLNGNGVYIDQVGANVLFYKSHRHDSKLVRPRSIIHIYRHPLDVFLSARSFFYRQAEKGSYSEISLGRLFGNSKPKSVEMMSEDGELDVYFQEFLEMTGGNYWPGMLGKESNYFNYVFRALRCPKTVSVKYEELLEDFENAAIHTIENALGTEFPDVFLNRRNVDKRTKFSGNSDFYWRAKARNYLDFLSSAQISAFYAKYRSELEVLGY